MFQLHLMVIIPNRNVAEERGAQERQRRLSAAHSIIFHSAAMSCNWPRVLWAVTVSRTRIGSLSMSISNCADYLKYKKNSPGRWIPGDSSKSGRSESSQIRQRHMVCCTQGRKSSSHTATMQRLPFRETYRHEVSVLCVVCLSDEQFEFLTLKGLDKIGFCRIIGVNISRGGPIEKNS